MEAWLNEKWRLKNFVPIVIVWENNVVLICYNFSHQVRTSNVRSQYIYFRNFSIDPRSSRASPGIRIGQTAIVVVRTSYI